MTTKTLDDKGRLSLGKAYAGKTVQINEQDGTLLVTVCRVVPEREAWLWDNDEAFRMVQQGIFEAHTGQLTDGPDLTESADFADSIPD